MGDQEEREGKESSLNQESTRLRKFRIQTEEEKDPGVWKRKEGLVGFTALMAGVTTSKR